MGSIALATLTKFFAYSCFCYQAVPLKLRHCSAIELPVLLPTPMVVESSVKHLSWLPSVRAGTQWQQSRKDVRHSGDKNRPLSTKLTELNMFNFGNGVDGNKSMTDWRQISDKVESPQLC